MSDDFLAALEGATNRARKKPSRKASPEKVEVDAPVPRVEPPTEPAGQKTPRKASRLTCYLFENDVRALASIRERLESVGHEFVNRSDAIKIALRLAAKTNPEQLSKVLLDVKREDLRFKQAKK